MRQWLMLIAASVLLASPALAEPSEPTNAEPELQAEGDRVVFQVPETDEVLWSFRHQSLQADDGQWSQPIAGPRKLGDRWLYSVGADVLEFDPAAGAIVDRTHYSLFIETLSIAADGTVEVTPANADSEIDGRSPIVFAHTGIAPGRGFWEEGTLSSFRASRDVSGYVSDRDWENSPDVRAEVAPRLLKAAPRDRTNPFYYGFLGLFAHLDGQETRADAHFAKAVEVKTSWFDTIRLCGILHRAERSELATKTCSRAHELMKARGIRPHAMIGLITYATLSSHHVEAMQSAVEASDYARMDAIADDLHRLFPRIEFSHHGWRTLAGGFEVAGKPALSEKWNERALQVEEATSTQIRHASAPAIDRLLVVLATIVLILPWVGLIIGFRTGRRKPQTEGRSRWIPQVSLAEAVSITLLLIIAVVSGHKIAKEIAVIGDHASMPITLLGEGSGSPDAVAWLEDKQASPPRDELLAHAQHELQAAFEGEAVTKDPPAVETIFEVIEYDAASSAWSDFLSTGSFKIFERASTVDGTTRSGGAYPPVGLPILGITFILLWVGTIVSRLAPRFVRFAGYALPGGTQNAGWATPWILGAFVAGTIAATTPLGTILRDIGQPSFRKYFGLSELDTTYSISSGIDAWLPATLVVAALLVHGILVIRDWRQFKSEGPGSTSPDN